jgi:hypothetical protein
MKRQSQSQTQTRLGVRETKTLTDAEIAAGFKRLQLGHLGKMDYTTPHEFARTFKRCTVLEDCYVTTTAHAGV